MTVLSPDSARPARIAGPVAFLALCLLAWVLMPGTAMAAATLADDHAQAVATLADVNAAIAELVRADASYIADPKVYHGAAERAINALAGTHGDGYVASAGSSGDAAGAIGHIDSLLNRTATLVWTSPLEGAEANIRAAVAHLQDAAKAHELMDYAIAASRALDYLQVARGRPNETGVFGGLEGVLANTELGVPAGAQQQDACRAPSATPSYGTHGGYIAWVVLPAGNGTHDLAGPSAVTSLSLQNGMIVLRTAAAKLVADACAAHAKDDPPDPPATQAAAQVTQTPPVSSGGPPPALYTKAQAERGQSIFATKCVACHGANLQGTAAPSVAGNDFLVTARHNGWTLEIMRYIVFEQMPRNAPSTLSPGDSADVMAYLLASSCYPAGHKAFPPRDDPKFANIKLGPVPGRHPGQNAKGVCKLN
ncbi:MAG TPA: cytochrome c [Acetobacteraceae bacterium]|jgi:mono/diheme cytochrome c family protein